MGEKRRHSKPAAPAGHADSDESPKNVKRDGKPATERHIPAVHDPEASLNPTDNDRGRRRRLQDPLPLEETRRGADGRTFAQQQQSVVVAEKDPVDTSVNAVPVNPTHVPRSGYYFQHDDRSVASAGRSNKRRAFDRDGLTETGVKARYNEKPREISPDHQARSRKNERYQESSQVATQTKAEDAWTHDKFLESQTKELERRKKQAAPLETARHAVSRAFREKPPVKSENTEEQKGGGLDKRSERRYPDMNLARRERERYRERGEDIEKRGWIEADQQGGRYNPRRGYSRYMGDGERPGGRFDLMRRNSGSNAVADKWTHDRFEELNRSPTPKQEEDNIAQIEALLAA